MTPPLPVAMLLDLDDTILSSSAGAQPCWEQVCAGFAHRLQGRGAAELLAQMQAIRDWFWSDPERHRQGRLDLDKAYQAIVQQALDTLGIDDTGLAKDMVQAFVECRHKSVAPFPGAAEALAHFQRQGVRLALVTNGQGRAQRLKIDTHDLARFFDYILIEGEFGVGKPDPRVFLHAMDQLGVSADETWMVGDNPVWEIAPPQELGIYSIWVDHAGTGLHADCSVRPDRTIRSLAELVT